MTDDEVNNIFYSVEELLNTHGVKGTLTAGAINVVMQGENEKPFTFCMMHFAQEQKEQEK